MAVPMAIVAKVVSFRSVKRRIALFRVAGVALCIVQMRFMCERCSAFASLSEDELQFSWQTQHFRDLHRHFLWHVHHFKRVALRFFFFCESHCQGCGIAVSKREIAKETLKERCLQLGFFGANLVRRGCAARQGSIVCHVEQHYNRVIHAWYKPTI